MQWEEQQKQRHWHFNLNALQQQQMPTSGSRTKEFK